MKRNYLIAAIVLVSIAGTACWAIGCRGGNGLFARFRENRQARVQARQESREAARAVWTTSAPQTTWTVTETAPAAPAKVLVEVPPPEPTEAQPPTKPAPVGDVKALQDRIDELEAKIRAATKKATRANASGCSGNCTCGCNEGGPCVCAALRQQTGRHMEYRPNLAAPVPMISGPVFYQGNCANGECAVPQLRYRR